MREFRGRVRFRWGPCRRLRWRVVGCRRLVQRHWVVECSGRGLVVRGPWILRRQGSDVILRSGRVDEFVELVELVRREFVVIDGGGQWGRWLGARLVARGVECLRRDGRLLHVVRNVRGRPEVRGHGWRDHLRRAVPWEWSVPAWIPESVLRFEGWGILSGELSLGACS
jgi:hypothetical protein